MQDEAEVRIVGYDNAYAADFARLNYEWIAQYFTVEPHDSELLDNPYSKIIGPGGEIFFAIVRTEVAGTAAMIPFNAEVFELSKMAVSPRFQRMGIANRLMEKCIGFARDRRGKAIFLETNSKLPAALALYRKWGFADTPLDPNSLYSRANVRMELAIPRDDM